MPKRISSIKLSNMSPTRRKAIVSSRSRRVLKPCVEPLVRSQKSGHCHYGSVASKSAARRAAGKAAYRKKRIAAGKVVKSRKKSSSKKSSSKKKSSRK